jgi:hypothetical protein
MGVPTFPLFITMTRSINIIDLVIVIKSGKVGTPINRFSPSYVHRSSHSYKEWEGWYPINRFSPSYVYNLLMGYQPSHSL